MPSFFKDLRRRSRIDPTTEHVDRPHDSESSSSNDGPHEDSAAPVHHRSSSTLNTLFGKPGVPTPPTRSSTNLSGNNGLNGAKTPPLGSERRPNIPTSGSSRYSIAVRQLRNGGRCDTYRTQGSPVNNGSPRAVQYTSPLAPRVNSVSDGSWVKTP